MSIELIGSILNIFEFCAGILALIIIVLGTWIILNYFIWEVLIRKAFSWTIYYKRLCYYLYYYHDIKNIIGNKANNLFKEEEKPPTK